MNLYSQRRIYLTYAWLLVLGRIAFVRLLLTPGFSAAQLLGDLFVNLAPVAHRENTDDSMFVVDGINDAETSHRVFPQPF